MLPEPSVRGECDWCNTYAMLHERYLPDDDLVCICSVCWWLEELKSENKDYRDIGRDMA